jgi:hypothetical protein
VVEPLSKPVMSVGVPASVVPASAPIVVVHALPLSVPPSLPLEELLLVEELVLEEPVLEELPVEELPVEELLLVAVPELELVLVPELELVLAPELDVELELVLEEDADPPAPPVPTGGDVEEHAIISTPLAAASPRAQANWLDVTETFILPSLDSKKRNPTAPAGDTHGLPEARREPRRSPIDEAGEA